MAGKANISRRAFLSGSAAVGVAAVAGGIGGVAIATAAETKPPKLVVPGYVPFDGPHQAGIVTPARVQTSAIFVALDAVVSSKPELATTFAEITRRSRLVTGGWAPEAGDPLYPPPESGIVGGAIGPSDLTITFGFGASLFDDRFGLGGQRPRQLTRMPSFPNDRLQPALSHGDLMVQICAADDASCIHALRYLMAGTRGSLVVRWMISGFQQRPGGVDVGGTEATGRNLLGFKDGTANPKASDTSLMDELVWVAPEPGRARLGGRRHVHGRPSDPDVRRALGPHRARRAASGHRPDQADRRPAGDGPRGRRPGLPDGSIRRTDRARCPHPPCQSTDASDPAEPHPSSWVFVQPRLRRCRVARRRLMFACFQQDLERGFVTVQNRLHGEALSEYIQPIGGGYFFAPPGTTPDGIIGGSLLA